MKKALLWSLFVVGVVALALTFTLAGGPTTIGASAAGIRYDSRSHTPIYQHTETVQAQKKQFSASFRFQPYSTSGYSDLFQTAPLGRGARVELHEKTAALIVPANNSAKFDVYVITSAYNTKAKHAIDISIDSLNHVAVSFDGQQVVNTTSPDLDYDISDITVGTGFLPDRGFKGTISDFAYSYKLMPAAAGNGWSPLVLIRVVLVIAILGLLFLLVRSGSLKIPRILTAIDVDAHSDEPETGVLR